MRGRVNLREIRSGVEKWRSEGVRVEEWKSKGAESSFGICAVLSLCEVAIQDRYKQLMDDD